MLRIGNNQICDFQAIPEEQRASQIDHVIKKARILRQGSQFEARSIAWDFASLSVGQIYDSPEVASPRHRTVIFVHE
jgi:hypothetical protein